MTVEEAIEKLKGLAISPRSSTHEEALALSMAISALKKENDNTKLKECQEIIDRQIEELLDYFNGQLSDEEQMAFNKGQRFRELVFVQESLKEKINETEKDH